MDAGLKRESEEMDPMSQPPTKRMYKGEGPRVEMRFLIPSKIAGVIIGKGGQNINRLRNEFSAKVNVPDSSGPERILVIEGELGSVEDILADVLPSILEENAGRGGGRGGGDDSRNNFIHPVDGDVFDLRLLVHQSQAGCVIGRGGFKIKELREGSGLKNLRVYSSCCPGSTDRVIQLCGEPEKLVNAVHTIQQLLETAPPKGSRTNYDARNYDEYNVETYGGWMSPNAQKSMGMTGGGGMGGGGGGGMGVPRGAAMAARRGGGAPGSRGAAMGGGMGVPRGGAMTGGRGGGMGRNGAGMGGRMGGDEGMGWNMFGGSPGGGGGGGMFGGSQGGGGGGNQNFMGGGAPGMGGGGGERTTTQVSIPENLTGSIMGKGGSRIKQIRAESGADIKIDKSDTGSSDRIITITGTQEQIQNSQYLLQMCVKKYSGQY